MRLGSRVPEHYDAALRGARAVRGKTITETSRATGLRADLISRWERGRAIPSPAQFAILWRYYAQDAREEEVAP
jgi:hypothetical protein